MIAVGSSYFLERYRCWFSVMSERFGPVKTLAFPSVPAGRGLSFVRRALAARLPARVMLARCAGLPDNHTMSVDMFHWRSAAVEKRLLEIWDPRERVLQLFAQARPYRYRPRVPFAMSMDYTMALAARSYRPWAQFQKPAHLRKWLVAEGSAYRSAYALFPWTECAARSLVDDYGVDSRRITMAGNGANLVPSPLLPAPPIGPPRLLMNASDPHRKGLDIAIEILKMVRQVRPEIELDVVGTQAGPLLDGVRMHGSLLSEQLKALLLRDTIMIAPARCEPFGNFLVEAMGHGAVCIVSNRDGMPEIVQGGASGVVVDDLDPKSWADQIIGLLEDAPRMEQLRLRAYERAIGHYSWESVVERMARGYSSIPSGDRFA